MEINSTGSGQEAIAPVVVIVQYFNKNIKINKNY